MKNDSACGDGSFDVEGKIGKGRNVWKLRALRPMVVIWSAAVGLFLLPCHEHICSKMFLLEGCFEEQLWKIGGGENIKWMTNDEKMFDNIRKWD